MALSLRGTGSDTALRGADVTVDLPAGIAENDVVVGGYGEGGDGNNYDMDAVTSGYTELADLYGNDNNDANFGAYWKAMGATPDSEVTFNGHGDSFVNLSATVHVWTGADTTDPIDATTTTTTGTNGAAVDSPSITTQTDGAVVISIGTHTQLAPGEPSGAPTNYGNLVDIRSPGSGIVTTTMMASREISSAGAENPGAFPDSAGGSTSAMCAATIAIKPAGAGGTTAEGGGDLALPAFALAAVGVQQPAGTGDLTLQAGTLTAVGEQPHEGIASPIIEALSLDSSAVLQLEATATPNIQTQELIAQGEQPYTGQSASLVESATLTASGILVPQGTAVLALSSFLLSAVAIHEEVVSKGRGRFISNNVGRMMQR